MSWFVTRPEGFDWLVNVRATMLDDAGWFTPFMETWTREKLPWATTDRLEHRCSSRPLVRRRLMANPLGYL